MLKKMSPVLDRLTEILNKIPPQNVSQAIALVQSNFFPDPQERSQIRESIAFNDESVLLLEQEIANIQVALKQLESRRLNIKEVSSLRHALLSPVRMLPDEVLSEVFTYVCNEYIKICSVSDTIWDLQRVCSRWRRIARDTPRIWSAFEVSAKSGFTPNPDMVSHRVKTCLRLSRNTPLSLSFPSDVSFGSPAPPFSIYTDIANHVDRWFSLETDGDLFNYMLHSAESSPTFRRTICERGFVNLRMLSLKYFLDDGTEASDDYDLHGYGSDVFKCAAALEYVKFSCIEDVDEAFDYFSWSNVRHLTLEHCRHFYVDERAVSAFLAMTALEVLVWVNTSCSSRSASQTSVLTLPSVHTLNLLDSEGPRVRAEHHPWPVILMPSLKTIQVKHDIVHFAPFPSLLKSSSSTITRLELQACSTAFFLNVIKQTSNVQELSLIYPTECISATILMLIWSSENLDDICLNNLPSLRKLEIHGNFQIPDEMMSSLHTVMRSRSKSRISTHYVSPISPLTCVKCSLGSCFDEDDRFMADLKYLGKELDINVEVVKI